MNEKLSSYTFKIIFITYIEKNTSELQYHPLVCYTDVFNPEDLSVEI